MHNVHEVDGVVPWDISGVVRRAKVVYRDQCQLGFRRVDPAGDLSIGKQAGLGVDYRVARITSPCARIERDGEGDRAKAMSLLDESLANSGELRMRPLMKRVLTPSGDMGA